MVKEEQLEYGAVSIKDLIEEWLFVTYTAEELEKERVYHTSVIELHDNKRTELCLVKIMDGSDLIEGDDGYMFPYIKALEIEQLVEQHIRAHHIYAKLHSYEVRRDDGEGEEIVVYRWYLREDDLSE